MHQKMTIRIKNWKLTFLALLFFALFTSLGLWQLSRAKQKELLLATYAEQTKRAPLTAHDLNKANDWRFYRASLRGTFDNKQTFLLDNKTFYGQIGYEVYTLFYAQGLAQPILIDRGFIPMDSDRTKLPSIKEINGIITLTGMLNLPPTYVAFGKINDSTTLTWPLRIEFIDLKAIAKLASNPEGKIEEIYPYILMITAHHPAAYPIEWKMLVMSPERHRGYALQWFALALTLLILWVALNRR
ncbi:MAG: hypothetical protein A3F11_08955 [Gammaproteobacteria bacterium RIFCSPHIGHO2_12_FULL_37_14]|nr:MAG: hypothetical protein A3F11_08955 [Gammaproteobacteria bacterium RIFCSPHIGHO2_12_FULL_37_14]